eukprot:COSAG05_NODE_330_length_11274_cov_4.167696_3_plen_332_part_00
MPAESFEFGAVNQWCAYRGHPSHRSRPAMAFGATPRPAPGARGGREPSKVLPVADDLPKKKASAADDVLTDEQAAELLLLRDPLCCECANRLGQVRAVTDRHRAEMQAVSVYSEIDGGGGGGGSGRSPTPLKVKEDKQRLEGLRQLEGQLERALQNQRRYVLGRCGLGHLADGLVHLEGLGRLAESSAWHAPGAPPVPLSGTQSATASPAASGRTALAYTSESFGGGDGMDEEPRPALFSPMMASRRLTQMLETGEIQPLRFSGRFDGEAIADTTDGGGSRGEAPRGGAGVPVRGQMHPAMSKAQMERAVLAQLERMEAQYALLPVVGPIQ